MDKETKELLKRTLSMTDDKLLLKMLAVQETVNATDRLQMGCTTLVSRVRKANSRRACLPDRYFARIRASLHSEKKSNTMIISPIQR